MGRKRVLMPADTRPFTALKRTILAGAGMSIGLRVAGVGFSYAANIVLSRLLGLHGFGGYVIALGWALVLTLPARAGFENSALQFVTVYLESGEFGRLRGFIRTAFATVFIVSLGVGGAMAIGGLASHSIPIVAGAAIILPLALLGVASPMMRAAQRIVSSQLYEQVVRPAILIVTLGVAWIIGVRLTVPAAMLLTAFAAAAALAALLVPFGSAFAPARTTPADYGHLRQWYALSVPMLIIASMQELMNQMEVILLGTMVSASASGLFAAAWRLASLTPFALAALTGIAAPHIASAHHRGSFDELAALARLIARAGLVMALVPAAMLIVWGRPLLSLFGPEFRTAYPALIALTVGGIANAFTGAVAYLMTLTGRERPALVIFAGALVVSIGFNLLLIPRFGALGAAIASSSATVAWNFAMLIYVRRALGIDASAIGLRRRAARQAR